jgi:hypothetical protein
MVLCLLSTQVSQAKAQEVTYKVRQDRLIGHRDGELIISESSVEYRTKNEKERRKWSYPDIKLFEILSPTRVRIRTYEAQKRLLGRDESLTFKIVEGELDQKVSDFLRAHIDRPFVTSFTGEEGEVLAEISVKHLHRFGGCQGTLKVYDNRLIYVAVDGRNSRSWRWTDIQTVGWTDKYRFEVSTYEPQTGGPKRSYNFSLKEEMTEGTYDLIWNRVFRPTPLIKSVEKGIQK